MTLDEFREMSKDLPGDTPLFRITGDHQARDLSLSSGFVTLTYHGDTLEFIGDEFLDENYEQKMPAIVAGG